MRYVIPNKIGSGLFRRACGGRKIKRLPLIRAFRAAALPGFPMHEALLQEYLPIALFLGVALVVAVIAAFISFALGPRRPDPEKVSAYECGFEAFSDARARFDVRFYLVAILFIIFDLEIAFLFPWAMALGDIGWTGFTSMMVFLGILTAGFAYEWKKGALEWE